MSQNLGVYGTHDFRDVLSTRRHTKGLIDLILSLDDELPLGADKHSHQTTIISAYFDYLTGYYHADHLNANMPNSKHLCLYSATHFLLIEWPEFLATEILKLIYKS